MTVTPHLNQLDTPTVVVGSLILALLLLGVFLLVRGRSSRTGSTILLVGPSDGGKTAIFSSLVFNQTPPTSTSLQLNTALYRPPSPFTPSPLTLVDVPGHPRIRGQFDNYLRKTKGKAQADGVKGIIFVCDVSALARNGSLVAEHLHLVLHALTSLPPSEPIPPLLILAHKADLLQPKSATGGKVVNTASAIQRLKTILERELEKRRLSSLSGGAGTGGIAALGEDEGEESGRLGGLDLVGDEAGKVSFTFDRWDGGEVTLHASWVDVVRRAGHGGADTDDEDEKRPSRENPGDPDGLAEVVEWAAGLR